MAVPLTFGLTGALPYFVIERHRPAYQSVAYFHYAVVAILLLALVCAYLALRFSVGMYLAMLLSGVLVVQRLKSTCYLLEKSPALASLTESGLYVVIVLFLLGGRALFVWHVEIGWMSAVLTAYLLTLITPDLLNLPTSRRKFLAVLARYRLAIGFGLPLILTSMLMIGLISSSRILLGEFLSVEAVAVYSLCFRIVSTVVIIHSLLNTLLFHNLYQAKDEAFDRYSLSILASLFFAALILLFVAPLVMPFFAPKAAALLLKYRNISWVLSCTVVFWVATAQLEPLIYRHRQAKLLAMLLLCIVTILFGTVWLLGKTGRLSILNFCQINMLVLAALLMGQVIILRSVGFNLVKVPIFSAAILAGYFAAYAVTLSA
ncbi:MAG: hypothetical protein PHY45_09720 [Rhodocyclaceae bacterium]|nr:hypothetical protein [Rhodocyclaceae bacterium]